MIKHLELRSEFTRNVLTLMTGSTIAQAIPFAISPLLTRIYSPQDFGVFSLFTAISMIFGSVANGRYELAIMLPDSHEDAINIAALGILIAGMLSAVLFVIVVIFNQSIADALGNTDIAAWLYLIPITVFFSGLFNVLKYFNNRLKKYQEIAQATILKSIVLAILQLSLGLLKGGAGGLIGGQVISNVFCNLKLLKITLGSIQGGMRVFSANRIRILGRRYQDFPKFSLGTIFYNLSQHLTSILISAYFSISTLGYYALVQRVLGVPSFLIGTSVGQVFFQEATREMRQTGKAVNAFDSTVRKLSLISVPIFLLFFFMSENIFAVVFGEQWRVAGRYAIIMTPLFAVRFILSSVSTINSVFEKQKIFFFWQVVLVFSSLGTMVFSFYRDFPFEVFLKILTFISTLHYFVLFFIMRSVSRGR